MIPHAAADERLLWWLVIAMITLFLVGVAFAAFASFTHWRRKGALARVAALQARWESVLHDVLAGDASLSAIHDVVPAWERPRFVGYLVDYAMRLRGEELEIVREIARPSLRMLAARSIGGAARGGQRARDMRALALLGVPEFENEVRRGLNGSSTLVSATIAQTLCRPEYVRYAPDVIAQLPRFHEWSPRFLGLLLARFGADVAPQLRDLLASTRPDALRIAAASALWRIGDHEAALVAERILEATAPSSELAAACLRVIEHVGSDTQAAIVRRYLDHEHDGIRSAAIAALATVGASSDDRLMERALRDSSPWVGLRAAGALRKSQPLLLADIAGAEDDARVAAIAREALSE